MIIKELIIENYLCYYDQKKFEFSDGLNIVLGENGEGKTKFFEAVEWLFKGDTLHLHQLVSARKFDEVAIGETFRVRVVLVAEQWNELKTIQRQFMAKKINETDCETSMAVFEGIEENLSGERTQVDGNRLLEQMFPATIRKYSMFKGETALDIFIQPETLMTLIQNFSDAKYFGKYETKALYLKEQSEEAVAAASRLATKNKTQYQQLENTIRLLENQRLTEKTFVDATRSEIIKLQRTIDDVANYVTNASDLETVNKRVNDLRFKIETTNSHIYENYTTSLFDDRWLLINYEEIHQQFADKINNLSIKRRELQSEHDREIGIKIGEKRAKIKMINDVIPLPLTVPTKAIMEEMLKDKVCKVCNTPAPVDSDPYNFMLARLDEYRQSQIPDETAEDDTPPIFPNNFTTKLVNISTSHEDNLASVRDIRNNIKDLFEFNTAQRKTVEKLNNELDIEIENRTRILGNSALTESKLVDALKSYNGWQTDLLKAQQNEITQAKKLHQIEDELSTKRNEKDRIDIESTNNFLTKTREVLRDIFAIFKDTKDAKYYEFVDLLQDLSNEYLAKINVGAFRGKIVLNLKLDIKKPTVELEFHEGNRIFYKPNQSLVTSMHISVLFAISQLAKERNEEGYPMIFDAPTSSFGETKTGAFLNLIGDTGSQIILLSKDYVNKDPDSDQINIKPEFAHVKRNKAFWIKVTRPFDPLSLKTINTEVITL
jgi:DNA sulfur modification protein DndD